DSSVSKPVGGVLGRRGDRRAGELIRGGKVAARDSPSGLGQQLLRRLAFDLGANRRRRDAQGLGQAYSVARHVLACKGLGLGGESCAGEQEKDGERAQGVKHVNLQMTCKRLNVNLAQVKRPLPKQT